MGEQRLPVDTESVSGPWPHVEVRMTRVEELAAILKWVPTLHVGCTGGSPTREASQTVTTWAYSVPDYDEMARAALAWMAERVPHTDMVHDVPSHDYEWRRAECRALGGRCAWEEK